MVGACANPSCLRRFRYLHEGKLFALRRSIGSQNRGDQEKPEFAGANEATEWFWLCEDCSLQMRLVCTVEHEVVVAPIEISEEPQAVRSASTTFRETEEKVA